MNEAHVEICAPFTDHACRYLTMGPQGWGCQKLTSLARGIDARVKQGAMRATGDNCPGVVEE